MEHTADTVAGEVAHHAVPESFGVGLDRATDDVDLATDGCRPDTAAERFLRSLHQRGDFRVDRADQERAIGIAVHPVLEGGDVDVHDVAVLQHRVVGNAVADDLVDG